MISVLLSNTSVNGLRGSGLSADVRTAADEHVLGRGETHASRSAAAPASQVAQSGSVPPLTAEAVLALQASEETEETDGKDQSGSEADSQSEEGNPDPAATTSAAGKPAAATSAGEEDSNDAEGDGLTEEEEKQVKELQKRDREVRAHEQAHARVGGPYAGAPTYTFQQGPDGKRYAIGGEVQIDTSTERTPDATIRKMQIVIRAATAPAEPSSQDLKVAQQARSQLSEAQAEKRQEQAEELKEGGPPGSADSNGEGQGGGADPFANDPASNLEPDQSGAAVSSDQEETNEIVPDRVAEANAAYRDAFQRASDIISQTTNQGRPLAGLFA